MSEEQKKQLLNMLYGCVWHDPLLQLNKLLVRSDYQWYYLSFGSFYLIPIHINGYQITNELTNRETRIGKLEIIKYKLVQAASSDIFTMLPGQIVYYQTSVHIVATASPVASDVDLYKKYLVNLSNPGEILAVTPSMIGQKISEITLKAIERKA